MRKTLLLSLLFLSISIQAKDFYAAKIELSDGNIELGYATLPSNQLFQKTIEFKSDLTSESRKIENDLIYRILFTLGNGMNIYWKEMQ